MAKTKWWRQISGDEVAEKVGSDLERGGAEKETKAGNCRWGKVAPKN